MACEIWTVAGRERNGAEIQYHVDNYDVSWGISWFLRWPLITHGSSFIIFPGFVLSWQTFLLVTLEVPGMSRATPECLSFCYPVCTIDVNKKTMKMFVLWYCTCTSCLSTRSMKNNSSENGKQVEDDYESSARSYREKHCCRWLCSICMWLIKAGTRAIAPDNLDHTTLHPTVTTDAKEVFQVCTLFWERTKQ